MLIWLIKWNQPHSHGHVFLFYKIEYQETEYTRKKVEVREQFLQLYMAFSNEWKKFQIYLVPGSSTKKHKDPMGKKYMYSHL